LFVLYLIDLALQQLKTIVMNGGSFVALVVANKGRAKICAEKVQCAKCIH
jgi:hypothetical protein